MSVVTDILLGEPSLADKIRGLQDLVSASAPPTVGGTGVSNRGQSVLPGGSTDYRYQVFDKPFAGTPSNLVTRQGVTLQRGPMRSLVDIARQSDLMPGIQEIGQITGGFRQTQPTGNPYAAPENMSYHEQGLAIDAGWWSERLAEALAAAGWNQFSPSGEPWHWSYGVTG
jgi:hypothetical protein